MAGYGRYGGLRHVSVWPVWVRFGMAGTVRSGWQVRVRSGQDGHGKVWQVRQGSDWNGWWVPAGSVGSGMVWIGSAWQVRRGREWFVRSWTAGRAREGWDGLAWQAGLVLARIGLAWQVRWGQERIGVVRRGRLR